MRLIETSLDQINHKDRALWHQFASTAGVHNTAYLTPQFADLVHNERGDVRVIIALDKGEPIGYFAYHEPIGGIARPVGAPLSDYQGFAAIPGFKVDEVDLLKAMKANLLVYNNWVGHAPGQVRVQHNSIVIDLSEGVDAWHARHKSKFKSQLKKLKQRTRKAEREFGPLKIVFGDPTGERYSNLKQLKSAQYQSTGALDLMSEDWTANVFKCAASLRFGPIRGLIASLYLGDQLAACEMGMLKDGTYHSWIPAYDPKFSSVSPGLLLLNGIMDDAREMGIDRIDLGLTGHKYKTYYCDYEIPVSAGRAVKPGFCGTIVNSWDNVERLCNYLPSPLNLIMPKMRRRWALCSAVGIHAMSGIRLMANAFTNLPKRLRAS